MTDPNRVTLWCDDDGCDARLTLAAPGADLTAEELAELRSMLVSMARRRGWVVAGRRHRCPACSGNAESDAVPLAAAGGGR